MNRHEIFSLVALATAYLSIASARPVTEGDPDRVRHVAVFGGSFSVIPPLKVAKAEWCRRANLAYHDYGVGGAGFVAQGHGGTNGIPVLEQHRLVVFPPENAADCFGKDKLHPNEKGYGLVKDLQADFLLKAL